MFKTLICLAGLAALVQAQVNVSAPTQVVFPASKFTCTGPAVTVCTLYDDTPATGASTLTIRAGPAQAGINLFNIYANDGVTAGLHVDSSRQVGIGTTAPGVRLQVGSTTESTTASIMRLMNTSTADINPYYSLFIQTNREWAMFTDYTNGGLGFGINPASGSNANLLASSKMYITTAGNVGIGTAAPGYLLDVAKGTGLTARFQDQTATTGDTHVLIDIGAAETASSEVFRINGVMRFGGTNTTGAGAALLGNNSPATVAAAPYTWFRALAADGTVVFIPAWK
jgi:hypothetical protein